MTHQFLLAALALQALADLTVEQSTGAEVLPSASTATESLEGFSPRIRGPKAWPVTVSTLPTDRSFRQDGTLPFDPPLPAEETLGLSLDGPGESIDYRRLIRPYVDFQAEWEPEVDGLSVASYDLSIKMPTYPIFGPPPPFISGGYSFTDIDAPSQLDLPSRLYDFSLGVAWMRPINDKWMARLTFTAAFATDLQNTSGDAFQARGGGFAMYRPNDRWSWAFGAIVTGRDDLPVIPAIGAIWEPSSKCRVDLMLPRPRISWLAIDGIEWQHWAYVGAGFTGGTWAYERANQTDDRLTYREWRAVIGWEISPPRVPGQFIPNGTRFIGELGYVFGREFEFDTLAGAITPGDAFLLRSGVNF